MKRKKSNKIPHCFGTYIEGDKILCGKCSAAIKKDCKIKTEKSIWND